MGVVTPDHLPDRLGFGTPPDRVREPVIVGEDDHLSGPRDRAEYSG